MEGEQLRRHVECHTALARVPRLPCNVKPLQHCVCRYETVTAQAEALQRPYHELSKLLKCSSHNIAILQSATTAWMQVCALRGECISNFMESAELNT